MRALLLRAAFASFLIGVWLGGQSEAQDGLTKRDAQGPVTVTVTLIPGAVSSASIRAKIVLDTHSVALDDVAFEQAVAMRTPDGAEVLPAAVEQARGGGHHREAVVVFPPPAPPGPVRIVVKNVGAVAERTFVWEATSR